MTREYSYICLWNFEGHKFDWFEKEHISPQLGVGDNIEKNYRKPINRHFWNYRQIIDIENRIYELSTRLSISKICIKYLADKNTKETVIKVLFVVFWLWKFILIQCWNSCTGSMKLHFVDATLSHNLFVFFVMWLWS